MSQPGVTLFPIPPPTLNNLDSQQRTRLLRSTRKLEALLGTTPYLFEQVDPTVSPRTAKAHRREARIFETPSSPSNSSPSSSRSSSPLKTPDSDGSFVLVTRSSSLENPLPPFKLTLDIDVPAEKQKGGSPFKTSYPKKKERSNRSTTKSKSKSKAKTAPGAGAKKGTVPSPLPHTLVLCLRSVPVSQVDARPGHSHANPSLSIFPPSNPSSHPATQNQIHTLQILNIPTTPTTPTTPPPLNPLSPISPTFNSPNHSESGSEKRGRNQERDQRRKKMAKLTRTLGENVPPELVFPSPVSSSVGLDTQKDAAVGLARKSSNTFRTKSQSISPPPSSSSSPSPDANTQAIPPAPSASPSASASPPPPALLERYSSRHLRERQGGAQLTVRIPEKKYTHYSRTMSLSAGSGSKDNVQSTDEDQWHDEGTVNGNSGVRNVADPAPEVQCPPSLAALFHPQLSSEENVGSLRFSKPKQQHLKTHRHAHSSPSSSPVDTKVFVNSDAFSDSYDTLLPTPARTRTPTPTPLSRLPSLLTRKSSKLGEGKAPKSHNAKSKSMGVVEEVFGVGFAAGRGAGSERSEDWDELSGVRERSGTPLPLPFPFPFPPPRSGTPHAVPSRSTTPHPQECGWRKEKGWSGEWNRGDMGEVVKALRELKGR